MDHPKPAAAPRRLATAMSALRADLKDALRHVRATPVVAGAVVAILTVVLTAGATVASLGDALVLRSLAVHEPGRLVALSLTDQQAGGTQIFRYEVFDRVDRQQTVFEQTFAFRGSGGLDLQAGETRGRGVIAAVTPEAFTTLGLTPALGRVFTAEDAPRFGDPARVVVIGHRLWHTLFAGDPDVVGRTLLVSARPLTVVGVLPASFAGLEPTTGNDFFVPATLLPHLLETTPTGIPNPRISHIVGRLKPGVTIERAEAEAQAIWPAVVSTPAMDGAPVAGETTRLVVSRAGGGFSNLRRDMARPLALLAGLAAILTLVGVVNLAGLMWARSLAQAPQTAVRLALGAPRHRLVRVCVIESLLLAVVTATLSLPIARALSHYVGGVLWQSSVPLAASLTPTGTIAAATFAVAGLVCLAVGLIPMLAAHRRQAHPLVPAFRAATTAERPYVRLLVVAQIALSVVLVACTGLFTASLSALRSIDGGFTTSGIVFGRAWQQPGLRREYDEQSHYPELVARLEALPQVASVSLSQYFPGYLGFEGLVRTPMSRSDAPATADTGGMVELIAPRFFETVGGRLIAGRDFTWHDRAGALPIVIVSESLASRLFPRGDAVGAHLRLGRDAESPTYEIVGVASNVTAGNLRSPEMPVAYRPRMQEPGSIRVPILLFKTDRDADVLRHEADAVARDLGHEHVRTLARIDEQIDAVLYRERLLVLTGGIFAAAAGLVTFAGLFALLAQNVVRRTREIGVRMALGAMPRRLVGRIVGQAVVLTAAGVALGMPGAVLAGQAAASLLYGTTPADPFIAAATAGIFLIIAVAAAVVPARRVARIDPIVALRAE